MKQYLKFVKYGYNTFYHRNNFGKNINCFSCVHEDVSFKIVCASCNVINIKYMNVCTILIFLIINYVVIE